jgi:hypothetical protein
MIQQTKHTRPVFFVDKLDPIDQFLVKTLHIDVKNGNIASLEEACSSFHGWSSLVSRSRFQGIIGWVHEALSATGEEVVPSETINELRHARLNHTARIATVKFDLGDIVGAFNLHGIGHILLKGPFLSEQVYPASGLRYYTDIDLLIRETDVAKAGEALAAIGYRAVKEEAHEGLFGLFEERMTQAHYYRERSLPLDLHWELLNLPSHSAAVKFDEEEVWRTSVPVQVAGVETRAMSPENVLLFQCLHMTVHHDFNRLLWFKDVQAVISRYKNELDWDLFVRKCEAYGLKTFVYYAILMASEACGELDVPSWVMDKLKPRYVTARLFEYLANRTNILEMQTNSRRPAIEVWKLLRDSRFQRWQALANRIFPEVRWYLECYPFLPKIRHQNLYYAVYPALMVLRTVKKPARADLAESAKSR